MRNTKKNGILRFMIYRSGGKYVAFCIELALVREGGNPIALQNKIESIAINYVSNVIKHKLDDDLLNQTLPKRYVDKFEKYEKILREQRKKNISREKIKQSISDSRVWNLTNIVCPQKDLITA